MPAAGTDAAARADAHRRWAERYDRQSNAHKAAAHFGRALEYDRRADEQQKCSKFGTGWSGGDISELHGSLSTVGNTGLALAAASAPVVAALVTAVGATAMSSMYDTYWSLFTPTEPVPDPKLLAYSLARQVKEEAARLKGAAPQEKEEAAQLKGAADTKPPPTLKFAPGQGGVGTNALSASSPIAPTKKPGPITTEKMAKMAKMPDPVQAAEPAADVLQRPVRLSRHTEVQHRLYFGKLKVAIDGINPANKRLLLDYTRACIDAHTELQKAKELSRAGWKAWVPFIATVEESSIRNKAKAFEQAINAILAGSPMNEPPEKQSDVDDTHSNAYTIMLENKGLVRLRADVLRQSEPYKNWPDVSCMTQALWDIYATVDEAIFSTKT